MTVFHDPAAQEGSQGALLQRDRLAHLHGHAVHTGSGHGPHCRSSCLSKPCEGTSRRAGCHEHQCATHAAETSRGNRAGTRSQGCGFGGNLDPVRAALRPSSVVVFISCFHPRRSRWQPVLRVNKACPLSAAPSHCTEPSYRNPRSLVATWTRNKSLTRCWSRPSMVTACCAATEKAVEEIQQAFEGLLHDCQFAFVLSNPRQGHGGSQHVALRNASTDTGEAHGQP